jgi:hypothetical protein
VLLDDDALGSRRGGLLFELRRDQPVVGANDHEAVILRGSEEGADAAGFSRESVSAATHPYDATSPSRRVAKPGSTAG